MPTYQGWAVITWSAVTCSRRAPILSRSADRAACCFSKANIRVKIAPTITPASAYTTFEFLSGRAIRKLPAHSIRNPTTDLHRSLDVSLVCELSGPIHT